MSLHIWNAPTALIFQLTHSRFLYLLISQNEKSEETWEIEVKSNLNCWLVMSQVKCLELQWKNDIKLYCQHFQIPIKVFPEFSNTPKVKEGRSLVCEAANATYIPFLSQMVSFLYIFLCRSLALHHQYYYTAKSIGTSAFTCTSLMNS